MTNVELIAIVLAGVVVGVFCVLLVQWAFTLRSLANELRETSRRVTTLTEALIPAARRVERLSRPFEDAVEDAHRMRVALGEFSSGVERVSRGINHASHWAALLGPVLIGTFEHLRAGSQGREREPESDDAHPPVGPEAGLEGGPEARLDGGGEPGGGGPGGRRADPQAGGSAN